jgi:hypothetical protein
MSHTEAQRREVMKTLSSRRTPSRASFLASLIFFAGAVPAATAEGPYVNGEFRGRIAYSADGNHNDPDDWAASPVALAIFAEAGLKDRLVHFDYNCILPQTNVEWEKIHALSVLGAAERYGYDSSRFFDCRKNVEAAIADIAKAIDAASAEDPLYFIVGGPMEVPYLGIQKSDPAKRPFVYCISHSRWNDGFATKYRFTHSKRSVIETGVHWVQIRDQNRLLSLSPYGKPAPEEAFAGFRWMRDSAEVKVRFLWERMLISTRPDPSDAGMAYFLAFGDEDTDPVKLRKLIADHAAPAPVAARGQIRLEAENFRELAGYEVEDRNDRLASHRLSVRPAKISSIATIRTSFDEPYALAHGRYDVELRYFDAKSGHCRFALEVASVKQSTHESAASADGWASVTFRNVEVASGDEILVIATGDAARLDYIQLNSLE